MFNPCSGYDLLIRIGVLGFLIGRLVRNAHAAILHGMSGEVCVLVNVELLGALEQPGEVIPEQRCVTDLVRADVGHLVNRDEGDDILTDELLAFVALAEAHVDLLALVDTVARVAGIGR